MKLPDVGEGVVDAEVLEWKVAVGDHVDEDQHIVDVMTDKATVEMTAPVSGRVLELNGQPGDRVAVGSPFVVFETEGGAGEVARGTAPAEGAPADEPAPESPPPAPVVAAPPAGRFEPPAPSAGGTPRDTPPVTASGVPGTRPLAAPTVRRRAREAHVDLSLVPGTGRDGRVTHDDLDRFIAGGVATAGRSAPVTGEDRVQEIRLLGMRRVIAENMARSKRSIPHFAYVEEVDITELEALRLHLNDTRAGDQPKLTLLPFLMLAVVKALREFPQCNTRFDDTAGILHQYGAVHCGIATQTGNGLMVPVVRHADRRDLWGCAAEMQRVTQAARDGKAAREELSGSTITITSLGPLGGIVSTPVINYPEVAIVGVNRAVERPMVREGQVVVRRMMNLSSSFDHRIVDGYDAASFIQRIRALLEYPATLFV